MFVEKYAIDGVIKDVGDVANSGEKAWHCIKLEEGWKAAKEGWNEVKNLYAQSPIRCHIKKSLGVNLGIRIIHIIIR